MLKIRRRVIALLTGVTLMYSSLAVSAEELWPEESQQELEQSNELQRDKNVVAENKIEENSVTPQNEYANTDITIAGVSFVESGMTTGVAVEGVSYDASTNTLILNNANIVEDLTGSIYTPNMGEEALSIYTDDELHVQVNGENNVSYMGADGVTRGTCSAVLLSGTGNVVFQGDGTLNIDQSFARQTAGIEAECDMAIESVTININSGITGDGVFGFTGILVCRTAFTLDGGILNIDASAVKNAGGFYGITDMYTFEGDPFVISGSTITIKGPEGAQTEAGYRTMNLGIDSQCRDIQISNSNIYMDMGTAASTFALAGGNQHYISREVMGGNITVDNSYIECRTNGQLREYSSYFQNLEGIENLHFYVGEYVPVRETTFEDAFKYTDESMQIYSRYEGQYRCFIISSEEVEIEISTGDINRDGNINLSDLMMCLNYVAGTGSLTDEQLTAADINSDGNVDLTDLMRLLAYTSGQSGTL